MPKIDNGGQAFPIQDCGAAGGLYPELGMTLRDYFAAHALPIAFKFLEDAPHAQSARNVADIAYDIADEMINIRKEV
jgi:hypothetical protein